MRLIEKNNDKFYYTEDDLNEEENQENSNWDYINETLRDLQDLQILYSQSQAQIIVAIGYLLEYTASYQAIEIILNRISKRNYDKNAGTYINEEEKLKKEEKLWENAGINADKTALAAAIFELYGQIIITSIDYIKLQRFPQNVDNRDFTLTKTANNEIFYGSVLELVAYILNYKGASILYNISNENVTDD
ncbi:hypothetical protein [uncultured Clostridium sp.]|uniref:hypothetical protein n=1 Tax=uncultured Clostridium sp. TaxID=59620 RepID=UPI0025ECEF87|nr:hypothetical protein [uncultured Clostridium sp.]